MLFLYGLQNTSDTHHTEKVYHQNETGGEFQAPAWLKMAFHIQNTQMVSHNVGNKKVFLRYDF